MSSSPPIEASSGPFFRRGFIRHQEEVCNICYQTRVYSKTKSTQTCQGKKFLLCLDSAVPSWGEYCGDVVAEDEAFEESGAEYRNAAR